MLQTLADELNAAPIQHIGKLLVLWQPIPRRNTEIDGDRMPGPRNIKVIKYAKRFGQLSGDQDAACAGQPAPDPRAAPSSAPRRSDRSRPKEAPPGQLRMPSDPGSGAAAPRLCMKWDTTRAGVRQSPLCDGARPCDR